MRCSGSLVSRARHSASDSPSRNSITTNVRPSSVVPKSVMSMMCSLPTDDASCASCSSRCDDRLALRVLLEQHLHRDALADQRVGRLVDRAHAALPDLARDEVAPRQRRRRSARSAGAGARAREPLEPRSSLTEASPAPGTRRVPIATAVSVAPDARHRRRVRSSARRAAAGYRLPAGLWLRAGLSPTAWLASARESSTCRLTIGRGLPLRSHIRQAPWRVVDYRVGRLDRDPSSAAL